jgi:hypothetical protein
MSRAGWPLFPANNPAAKLSRRTFLKAALATAPYVYLGAMAAGLGAKDVIALRRLYDKS